ncbi:hypothetical protein BAE44_0011134, partial [Dichanthelium oligosanthes]
LFQHAGPTDPTRELEAELPRLEVVRRVASVLKTGVAIEAALNNHPPARSVAHNPRHVSLFTFPLFLPARVMPIFFLTLVFPLH